MADGDRRAQGRRASRVVTAVIALLALSRTTALLHFVFVDHHLSPETGDVVHGHRSSSDRQGQPVRGQETERCDVYLALHQLTSPSWTSPVLPAPSVVVRDWQAMPRRPRFAARWPIYWFAPSHSPPPFSSS